LPGGTGIAASRRQQADGSRTKRGLGAIQCDAGTRGPAASPDGGADGGQARRRGEKDRGRRSEGRRENFGFGIWDVRCEKPLTAYCAKRPELVIGITAYHSSISTTSTV
jgi:hypothetical protein